MKESSIPLLKNALRPWLHRLEMDRAVVFGVLVSLWQLGSAPVTILLIARHLTAETQGFYYTFGSLLALQTYVELGLSVVVLNVASHEWAHLGLDDKGRIGRDPDALSRLVSLGRLVFKWYAVASALFVGCVGVGGYFFFSQKAYAGVLWKGPWWAMVILSGLSLWTLPFISLLEGCNQVVKVQKFRLSQLLLRSLALWFVLVLDGRLWTAVAAMGVSLLREIYFLGVEYRRFFEPFFRRPAGPQIHWKTEIWPMQWRLAIGGLFSYFLFNLFTPVMFQYHGAVIAGQMGMTLSVVSALQGVAGKWLQPRVPRFGMLISLKDYSGLDRLWWRTTRVSFVVAATGALVVWLLIYGFNVYDVALAKRLLPPLPSGLFLLGAALYSLGYCETAYLRAHKQEPILVLGVVTSILMGLLVWGLGKQFGAIGAAVAYVIVFVGISLPWQTMILLRCRAEWHRPQSSGAVFAGVKQ